ncbi:MAG: hypothetical protein LHW57_00750 [Candidatus Cloacimonetes bacterium]|jgi:hypothetical protein|nr:hypothetical protein [Candidatus Cloacimonadota bacterium]
MLERLVLILVVLFVITFLAASEIDYSAIDPFTLPVYLGSLNGPGVEIRYEDSEGEYIIIEIGDIIYVFYALE